MKEDSVSAVGRSPSPQDHTKDADSTTQKAILDSGDVDIGAQYGGSVAVEVDPAVMRKTLWKIDLYVLPLLA